MPESSAGRRATSWLARTGRRRRNVEIQGGVRNFRETLGILLRGQEAGCCRQATAAPHGPIWLVHQECRALPA